MNIADICHQEMIDSQVLSADFAWGKQTAQEGVSPVYFSGHVGRDFIRGYKSVLDQKQKSINDLRQALEELSEQIQSVNKFETSDK